MSTFDKRYVQVISDLTLPRNFPFSWPTTFLSINSIVDMNSLSVSSKPLHWKLFYSRTKTQKAWKFNIYIYIWYLYLSLLTFIKFYRNIKWKIWYNRIPTYPCILKILLFEHPSIHIDIRIILCIFFSTRMNQLDII